MLNVGCSLRFHTDAANPQVPSAPELMAEDNGPDYLTVGWQRPADGGAEILRYELERNSGGSSPYLPAQVLKIAPPFTSVSFTAVELLGATAYKFRVRAFNRVGASNTSNELVVTTGKPTPPTAPGLPQLTMVNCTALGLEWKPSKPNGAPVSVGVGL